jgi:glycine/D-amino acid oxidase-like deaminating enzyme
VAAGHEGSGLTLAPATAALAVEQMLGAPPAGLSQEVVDLLAVPF